MAPEETQPSIKTSKSNKRQIELDENDSYPPIKRPCCSEHSPQPLAFEHIMMSLQNGPAEIIAADTMNPHAEEEDIHQRNETDPESFIDINELLASLQKAVPGVKSEQNKVEGSCETKECCKSIKGEINKREAICGPNTKLTLRENEQNINNQSTSLQTQTNTNNNLQPSDLQKNIYSFQIDQGQLATSSAESHMKDNKAKFLASSSATSDIQIKTKNNCCELVKLAQLLISNNETHSRYNPASIKKSAEVDVNKFLNFPAKGEQEVNNNSTESDFEKENECHSCSKVESVQLLMSSSETNPTCNPASTEKQPVIYVDAATFFKSLEKDKKEVNNSSMESDTQTENRSHGCSKVESIQLLIPDSETNPTCNPPSTEEQPVIYIDANTFFKSLEKGKKKANNMSTESESQIENRNHGHSEVESLQLLISDNETNPTCNPVWTEKQPVIYVDTDTFFKSLEKGKKKANNISTESDYQIENRSHDRSEVESIQPLISNNETNSTCNPYCIEKQHLVVDIDIFLNSNETDKKETSNTLPELDSQIENRSYSPSEVESVQLLISDSETNPTCNPVSTEKQPVIYVDTNTFFKSLEKGKKKANNISTESDSQIENRSLDRSEVESIQPLISNSETNSTYKPYCIEKQHLVVDTDIFLNSYETDKKETRNTLAESDSQIENRSYSPSEVESVQLLISDTVTNPTCNPISTEKQPIIYVDADTFFKSLEKGKKKANNISTESDSQIENKSYDCSEVESVQPLISNNETNSTCNPYCIEKQALVVDTDISLNSHETDKIEVRNILPESDSQIENTSYSASEVESVHLLISDSETNPTCNPVSTEKQPVIYIDADTFFKSLEKGKKKANNISTESDSQIENRSHDYSEVESVHPLISISETNSTCNPYCIEKQPLAIDTDIFLNSYETDKKETRNTLPESDSQIENRSYSPLEVKSVQLLISDNETNPTCNPASTQKQPVIYVDANVFFKSLEKGQKEANNTTAGSDFQIENKSHDLPRVNFQQPLMSNEKSCPMCSRVGFVKPCIVCDSDEFDASLQNDAPETNGDLVSLVSKEKNKNTFSSRTEPSQLLNSDEQTGYTCTQFLVSLESNTQEMCFEENVQPFTGNLVEGAHNVNSIEQMQPEEFLENFIISSPELSNELSACNDCTNNSSVIYLHIEEDNFPSAIDEAQYLNGNLGMDSSSTIYELLSSFRKESQEVSSQGDTLVDAHPTSLEVNANETSNLEIPFAFENPQQYLQSQNFSGEHIIENENDLNYIVCVPDNDKNIFWIKVSKSADNAKTYEMLRPEDVENFNISENGTLVEIDGSNYFMYPINVSGFDSEKHNQLERLIEETAGPSRECNKSDGHMEQKTCSPKKGCANCNQKTKRLGCIVKQSRYIQILVRSLRSKINDIYEYQRKTTLKIKYGKEDNNFTEDYLNALGSKEEMEQLSNSQELLSQETVTFSPMIVKQSSLKDTDTSDSSQQVPDLNSTHTKVLENVLSDKSLICDSNYCEWLVPKEITNRVILQKVLEIFMRILNDIDNCRFPSLKTRNEKDWSNVTFSNDRLTIIRGTVKTSKIQYNPSTIEARNRKFEFVIWILTKIVDLIIIDKVLTKREIYYQMKDYFKNINTGQVDSCINFASNLLNYPPWDFNIFATNKGTVFGDLTIHFFNGDTLACNLIGGVAIPSNIHDINKIRTNARFILVVEKDAIFQKLLTHNFPNKLNANFIMISGKGYPDIMTRLFVKKIWQVASIPVFMLVDCDPYGIEIMLNYRFGSKAQAHISHYLALPQIRWLGIFPSEVVPLNIKTLPLTQRDRAKIQTMLNRPYIDRVPSLRNELNLLLSKNFKAHIEGAFKGDNFMVDYYFSAKWNRMNFM